MSIQLDCKPISHMYKTCINIQGREFNHSSLVNQDLYMYKARLNIILMDICSCIKQYKLPFNITYSIYKGKPVTTILPGEEKIEQYSLPFDGPSLNSSSLEFYRLWHPTTNYGVISNSECQSIHCFLVYMTTLMHKHNLEMRVYH